MSKTTYRYFAGLLRSQANWLNSMAAKGLRLTDVGMLAYEFEDCEPGEYEYTVEYVGHKSASGAESYKRFLQEMGYRVFFKNINLNVAYGKVYLRPYAEPGGRLGTSGTTLNKELLIVEKKRDGRPFDLRTTNADRLTYMKHLRNPWLYLAAVFTLCGAVTRQYTFFIPGLLLLIPVLLYQREILRLAKAANLEE